MPGDDVLEPAEAVLGLQVGGEELEAGGDDDRARPRPRAPRLAHVEVDRVHRADVDALVALGADAAVEAAAGRGAPPPRSGAARSRGSRRGRRPDAAGAGGSRRRVRLSGGRGRLPCPRPAAARRSRLESSPWSQRSIMCAARRPWPTASRDVDAPVHDVAGGEHVRHVRSAASPDRPRSSPFRSTPTAPANGVGVGRHPDRDDHDLAGPNSLPLSAPVDRRAAGAPLASKRHAALSAADARHAPLAVEPRRPGVVENSTPSSRRPRPRLVRRHLVPRLAAVGDVHGARRPAGARRPGRVHGDVAAADDHDLLARQVGRLAELDRAQESEPAIDAVELLAGDAEPCRARRAGRDQDGVVALAPSGGHDALDRRARHDLDAERGDVGDVALDHLGGQPVGRDREAQEAARLGRGLEDLDA